jgi:hypothetical protein
MFTPPSGLNIIWLIKFDNGKLKYLQSKKHSYHLYIRWVPSHLQKPSDELRVYVERIFKGGRFVVLKEGAKAPVGFR